MTLWGTVTALQATPDLDTETVDLSVDLGVEHSESALRMTDGIRALYQKCQLYDVLLVAAGSRFPAHQAVLASLSPSFHVHLRQAIAELEGPQKGDNAVSEESGNPSASLAEPVVRRADAPHATVPVEPEPQSNGCLEPTTRGHPELRFPDISHPEAVPALLDFVYGLSSKYKISSDAANTDVLRLAKQFDLPHLTELAAFTFADNMTTDNAVSRLATCEEFDLGAMFSLIADAVIDDSEALVEVSNKLDLVKHPDILQKLLVQSAARYMPVGEADESRREEAPSKRRRTKAEEMKADSATGGA